MNECMHAWWMNELRTGSRSCLNVQLWRDIYTESKVDCWMVPWSWLTGCPTGKLSVWGWTSEWRLNHSKEQRMPNNHSGSDLDLCHSQAIDSSSSLWGKNPKSLTREREKGLKTLGSKRDWTWTRSVFTKSLRGHLNKEIRPSSRYAGQLNGSYTSYERDDIDCGSSPIEKK